MGTNSGDLVGHVLGGCKLERLIGQGGMSAVYLARQLQPERYVAVKVLMPHLDTSSGDYAMFLARFRREANIVAKLEHINIVPLYAYGEERQFAYLVMPYIAGGSLSDVINTQGTLSLPQTLYYLQQAAAALDYAHEWNVVHRDLKPSNFLLYPKDNRLVLADFGVARIIDEHPLSGYEATLTQTGVVPGTLAYMAPEMLQDARNIDYRVDIYALGIVLYQLLSGQLPFTGDLFSLINKHMEEALPPLHQQNPTIPASIDSVLRRATAKRRQERYASAGQLASDFLNAMEGKALQANVCEGVKEIGKIKKFTTLSLGDDPHIMAPIETLIADMKTVTPSLPSKQTDDNLVIGGANLPSTGAEMYTVRPRKLSHKGWLLLVASLLIVVLLVAGLWVFVRVNRTSTVAGQPVAQPGANRTSIVVGQPIAQPGANGTPISTEPAKQVIQQYYVDLNNHDYQAAYNLFGPEYQQNMSYTIFFRDYKNFVHGDVTFESVTIIGVDTVNIVVTVHAMRTSPQIGSRSLITRHGYQVVLHNGIWKIHSWRRLQ